MMDGDDPHAGGQVDRTGVERARRPDRGQSVVLGAILLFGILVLALGLYQLNVVPQQNGEVEFAAYQAASGDMVGLHESIRRTSQLGTGAGQSVTTGASYPVRSFTRNPPNPTGAVGLTAGSALVLTNARAINDETADHLTGAPERATLSTKRVVFRPDYNELQASPVVTGGGVAYRQTGEGSVAPLTDQSLVSGSRISLIAVDGELDVDARRVALSVDPVSASTKTVAVTASNTDDPDGDGTDEIDHDPDGDGDPELTLRVPTELSADAWETELIGEEPNVEAVEPAGDGAVRLRLRGVDASGDPIVYRLRLGQVEVRERDDDPVLTEPGPRYIVPTSGEGASITTEESVALTAEVRDRFNNPVPGAEVEFSVAPAGDDPDAAVGTLTPVSDRTAEEGRATTRYDPAGRAESVIVTATCSECAGDDDERVTQFQVDVSAGPDAVSRAPQLALRDVDANLPSPDDTVQVDTYDLTAQVRDQNADLTSVTFRLLDPDATDFDDPIRGPISTDVDLSGEEATITQRIVVTQDDRRDQYELVVVATDNDGNVDAEHTIVNGSGPTDQDGTDDSGNQAPTVTVDQVDYQKQGKDLTVTYTPDDPDGNLDTVEIVVKRGNGNEAARREVDVTGLEGQPLTETFSGGLINNGGTPYTVTITATDTDGAIGRGDNIPP